ncbi:hypothetical protein [Clostridium cylindrosporum]|uniref:Cthe-2314-like HEPN domain-containing protein n=1 Tax=Clostridium cylindrosporum DSM 605 TaxID=1121307 RepID=A0A0J8DBA0_CLOCY|nr:hypothetical protein [Clostridium cylindrosporum]KMT23112.1 hypothetical protein CLCY_7c01590 [Clostridium cylindrosporum DSM 605]
MNTIYDKVKDIHYLLKYTPYEDKYGLYTTNILFTAIKIVDVYHTICIARANLHYMDNDDYGNFASDEISKLFVNTLLIQNALIYYNFAIDYSWQVMWLYYSPMIKDMMPTNELYESTIKECDYQKLRLRLTLANEFKLRKFYLENFFENNNTQEIRKLYNFIKHRGTVHFPGLGMNENKASVGLFGMEMPLISRESIDPDKLKNQLIDLDNMFVEYFEEIIGFLIPSEYLLNGDGIRSCINYYQKYKHELKEYNKKWKW